MSDKPDDLTAPLVANPRRLNNLLTDLFQPLFGNPDPVREVRVHPAAFSFTPQGHRLLVVQFPQPEEYSGLVIPKATVGENGGLGVVMSIGWEAFGSETPHPGCSMWHPRDILYRTVVYGSYAGKPLRLDYLRDSMFHSDILVMTDRDIWSVRRPVLNAPYQQKNDYLQVGVPERVFWEADQEAPEDVQE